MAGDVDGCHNPGCLDFARKEVREAGVYLTGIGGSRAARAGREQSDTFHRDMYAYEAAVKQGVSPDQVTKVASDAALRQAEDNE